MQRIFKRDDIQNSSPTPDKELNISIYETPSHVIICRSYNFLKIVSFWPTLHIGRDIARMTLVVCNKLQRLNVFDEQ